MRIIKHITVILVSLFIILGIPTAIYVDITALFHSKNHDAVSRATLALPEQPSGEFVILLNRERHNDTVNQWETFFSGSDAGVIMDDICCCTIESDLTGIQLAERYRARLPENQMRINYESGLFLVSKAEYSLFDLIILSKEAADIYGFDNIYQNNEIVYICVKGE